MSSILIAYPLNDNNVEVPYELDVADKLDIALTLTIQDVQDVTKRRGSFSKTINLPSTDKNDACFGFAYNVQSFIGGFNPNKRIRCALWDDGVQTFNGTLQLLAISKTNGNVTYEIGIYSDEIAFFRQINETLLCQTSGVSGFNHTLTSGLVTSTWTATQGSGYVYGFIDGFGYSDAVPNTWNALTNALLVPYVSLVPSFYVKQLVDLIFDQAGYRYESNFFNSARFKSLVVPYAGGAKIQTDLAGQNSYVLASGVVEWLNSSPGLFYGVIDFNNEISDPQNYWRASGTFDNVDFYTSWDYDIRLQLENTKTISVDVEVTWWDKTTNTAVGTKVFDVWLGSETKEIQVMGNIRLDPNHDYDVRIFYFYAGEGTGLDVFNLIDASVSMICTENLNAVSTVDMRYALPMDIKQSDFLSDLQKMFNLYFYVSPLDPKLIYIEPFNDFYTSGSVDWTEKVDEKAKQLINMGDPEMRKTITFKYKDSGDALGKIYSDTFSQGYGARVFQTDNYYAKGEQVIETKCATVIPANYNTGMVIGRTFDLNANGTVKERPTGYRIAQYNYIVGIQTWVLLLNNSPEFASYSDLPYIGHIDNPYAPTFDLAFGMPMQLYYKTFASGSIVDYTNANLFNTYWKTYIEETTSKEAMQIEVEVILNASDIYNLDFRTPIYYKGMRWRLIEIRDYTIGDTSKCTAMLRRILNLPQPNLGSAPVRNYYDVDSLTLGEMNPQISQPTQL